MVNFEQVVVDHTVICATDWFLSIKKAGLN